MQSPNSRTTSGARTHSQSIQVPFTAELRNLTKSSARFGTLSHHSFFSRHNPHPHRVRHIQGLNGRPVCTVKDDWFVTSSLFPHPLLKSHAFRRATDPLFPFPAAQSLNEVGGTKKSALFSEAWREELKELATKVKSLSQANKDKREVQPEEELIRRKTQYSAKTGRIIPPPTKSYQWRPQHLIYPQPFHDQELMVLELLCQILQTDSLSTVQQWLLLAGQREKDLVMGMIKHAVDGVDLTGRNQPNVHLQAFHEGSSPPLDQPWRQPTRTCQTQLDKMNRTSNEDRPQKIGDAEVLEVHAEESSRPQRHPV
ncbi:protein TBATA isoform X2 [Cynoglossus semilaevis]|uniref:Thymus, brain and testes associated n=1 Tax=Cynoglossus semilaevis TaxID=244447 RepID=A0A3P8WHF2_CYNSE|nr:protein TBATA isoform X2 [Cynoglossus semilaevis]